MIKLSKKGFTLIEVLLSITIFAIISIGFLSMFSTVFINMYQSKAVTEGAFLAQEQIEQNIVDVKTTLETGGTPTGFTTLTITLFSGTNARSVLVYDVTQATTVGQSLQTFVSAVRPPVLLTPVITSGVTIAVSSNSVIQTYPNIAMPSLSVDLSTDLVVNNPGLLIRYVYYWYISKSNQYIPTSPPVFPDDYEIITDHTSHLISTVPSTYAGRFLKLVVIPVGEKAQMGTAVQSNDLYISPFPVNTGSLIHVDASYINPADTTTQVRIVTAGTSIKYYVKNWTDLDSTANNLIQATTANQPILYNFTLGTGESAQYVQGITGVAGVATSLMASTPSIGSKTNLSVYFAAKFDDDYPVSTTLFQSRAVTATGNRWELKTDANGDLVLVRYTNSANTTSFSVTCTNASFKGSVWNVFKLSIFQDTLDIDINGSNACTLPITTTATLQLTEFKVNFDYNFTLGELIIYDAKHLSSSADSIAITQYLQNKFQPQAD
jgi:prepilin-type N-terminal cleavage/methylation domain-containing protein